MYEHVFTPFGVPQYERCTICGTLHSIIPFPRENYLQGYWGTQTHSTLMDQRYNLEVYQNKHGETKVESVLKYCQGKSILEVACAPGSFLKKAKAAGFDSAGIEPDPEYAQDIRNYAECPVNIGFFEDLNILSTYDNIVAMDLLEHLEDGVGFINKCMSLLNPGGRLILMAPLIYTDGKFEEKHFHPEHIWLYSQEYIAEWLNPSVYDRFEVGHEIIVIDK